MTAGRMLTDRRRLAVRLARRAERDPLLCAVRRAGAETGVAVWLVGGAVRDAALGRAGAADDIDLAAGRPAARLVRRLEQSWTRRGFRFRKRGVTTYRFDVGEGRRVDVVDAGRRGIDGDLARRDLTINAVAFDLERRRILDPLGGLRDLRAGRLRPPRPEVMREDPLRALRVARFVAQLSGFRPTPAARRAAGEVAPRLRRVSAERIRDELDKLLCSPDPRRGLETLAGLGLLPAVLPELLPLRDCVAGADRPDVWTHTLDALALSARPGRMPGAAVVREPAARRVLRWSLLLHDIAKPDTLSFRPDGRPAFHGHEELGARRADALLRRLKVPRPLRVRVRRLVRLHLRPGHLADAGAPGRGLRRLARDAADDLPALVLHAACDAKASGSPGAAARWRRLRRVLQRLLELQRQAARAPLPRLLDGRDVMRLLGLREGPEVGRVLDRLEERQAEGRVRDRRQAIRFVRALARD